MPGSRAIRRGRTGSSGRTACGEGWGTPGWPKSYGGGWLADLAGADRRAGNHPHGRLQPDARHGHAPARTDDAGARQRGAEAAASEPDFARRGALVPGLFGAWFWLRSGEPADESRGQGRPLPGQRPEDLDLGQPLCRLVLLSRPDRPEGEAGRHQLPPDRHENAGRRGAADQDHFRGVTVLGGSSPM